MKSLQVSDYMNHHPVTLKESMPVAEAVEKLLASGQTGGPVLDSAGKICGFLSEQDCIQNMIESTYYREQVCRVSDIMQRAVLTVKPYTSVIELAQTMLIEKPKVYPVIDDDGELVGCINRTNVLSAIDKHIDSGFTKKVS